MLWAVVDRAGFVSCRAQESFLGIGWWFQERTNVVRVDAWGRTSSVPGRGQAGRGRREEGGMMGGGWVSAGRASCEPRESYSYRFLHSGFSPESHHSSQLYRRMKIPVQAL